MENELDDPRSGEYTFYRWNPFEQHWEFWDKITESWYRSGSYGTYSVDFELPKGFMELMYVDTWAEPSYGGMYA